MTQFSSQWILSLNQLSHFWGQVQTDITSIRNTLVTADVSALKHLTAGGIQPSIIEEAFRQKTEDGKATVARRFFENAASSPGAMAWCDSVLGAGVDPNMTVPGMYYEREGILLEAMRAGNIQAMKTLLRRGASPHSYQELFLTSFKRTRFLFPLRFIADDDRFSLPEKQDLTKAFLEAGVVIPKVFRPRTYEMVEAQDIQNEVAPKLGIQLPLSPVLCEEAINPICKQASSRTGDNWCAMIAAMPKKLVFTSGRNGTGFPTSNDVEVLYLLSIERNTAYFLGVMDTGFLGLDYVLVEVSRDASSWSILRFMEPWPGMVGPCKPERDTSSRSHCWRRIPLQRVAGTDEMRSDDLRLSWKLAKDSCSAPLMK